jgi:hypothetical protein
MTSMPEVVARRRLAVRCRAPRAGLAAALSHAGSSAFRSASARHQSFGSFAHDEEIGDIEESVGYRIAEKTFFRRFGIRHHVNFSPGT